MEVVIETPRNAVVDRLEKNGWGQGNWGDEDGPTCLHGAIRLCCPVKGDAFLIEQVASRRDRGPVWNDASGRTFEEVKNSLLSETLWDITDSDLEATFGPGWRKVVKIVRQAATITPEQAKKLSAAWDAAWGAARSAAESAAWRAACRAAYNAAYSAAWGAARSAAESAAESAAYNAAYSAAESAAYSAAWSAAAWSAQTTVVLDLVGQHGLEQHHIDTLMGPWNNVFGEEGSC